MEPFERILVRAPNPLGDAVMATPLLRCLRRSWPRARTTVLAMPSGAEAYRGLESVDRVEKLRHRACPTARMRRDIERSGSGLARTVRRRPRQWSRDRVRSSRSHRARSPSRRSRWCSRGRSGPGRRRGRTGPASRREGPNRHGTDGTTGNAPRTERRFHVRLGRNGLGGDRRCRGLRRAHRRRHRRGGSVYDARGRARPRFVYCRVAAGDLGGGDHGTPPLGGTRESARARGKSGSHRPALRRASVSRRNTEATRTRSARAIQRSARRLDVSKLEPGRDPDCVRARTPADRWTGGQTCARYGFNLGDAA